MSRQQQQPHIPTSVLRGTPQRRHTPQQIQSAEPPQAGRQLAPRTSSPEQTVPSQAQSGRRSCMQWMEETTFTFSILNLTLAALAFAAAVAYGTKSILQADIANHYGKQSRDIALWQACIPNPENPQITSSKWCAAHTTSNFDSDFTERDILPSEPKYILRLPEHCHLPPDLEKDSCQIRCSKQHKEGSIGGSFADGKTIKWETKMASFDFGSVVAVIAIIGAVIYFGSVALLAVFFGAVILMLRSTARRKVVPEARSGHARAVDFRSGIALWKSSCRRIKEAVIPKW